MQNILTQSSLSTSWFNHTINTVESFSIEELHSLTQNGLVSSDELTLIESHFQKSQITKESIIELKNEIRKNRKK